MAKSEDLRKYLEAAVKLMEPGVKYGRERAEELLRDLVKDGEAGRERVEDLRDQLEELVEEVFARSRRGSEFLREMIRQEVQRQVELFFQARRDEAADVVKRGVSLLGNLFENVPGWPKDAPAPRHNPAPTEVTVVGEVLDSTREHSLAVPAKKAAAKKAAGAKKAPGVKKAAPANNAAAKKVPAKKVPAKKAAPRKAGGAPS